MPWHLELDELLEERVDRPARIALDGETSLGRDASQCTVKLDVGGDSTLALVVSRKHATISFGGAELLVPPPEAPPPKPPPPLPFLAVDGASCLGDRASRGQKPALFHSLAAMVREPSSGITQAMFSLPRP